MARDHVERADFPRLVIGRNMDYRQPFSRAAQPLAVPQRMMLRFCQDTLGRHKPLPVRLEGLEEEGIDGRHSLTLRCGTFSLRSHLKERNAMAQPAEKPADELSPEIEIEAEVNDLIAEHGSERAAIRALLHDFDTLLADADRSTSRGFLRGVFSAGARPIPTDDEP